MANFIFGHPGETEQDMKETIQFARALQPFNAFFLRMVPLPDVEIFKNGVSKGEIQPDIWTRYMKGEIEHPVYYPASIAPEVMDKLFRQAYIRFYFSIDALKSYLPLLADISFLKRSVPIFSKIAFGKPVFK